MARRILSQAYYQRERFPKWNIEPTVLDEPRLMKRLPAFRGMSKAEHLAAAKDFAAKAKRAQDIHQRLMSRRLGGHEGGIISGGFYENYPHATKEMFRSVAYASGDLIKASAAHWKAAGKRGSWRSELWDKTPDYRRTQTRRSR